LTRFTVVVCFVAVEVDLVTEVEADLEVELDDIEFGLDRRSLLMVLLMVDEDETLDGKLEIEVAETLCKTDFVDATSSELSNVVNVEYEVLFSDEALTVVSVVTECSFVSSSVDSEKEDSSSVTSSDAGVRVENFVDAVGWFSKFSVFSILVVSISLFPAVFIIGLSRGFVIPRVASFSGGILE